MRPRRKCATARLRRYERVIRHRQGVDDDVTASLQKILILPEELDRQAVLEDQPQQVDEPANLVVSHLEGIGVRDQHAGSRRDPGGQAVLDEEDRLPREAVFNMLFQFGVDTVMAAAPDINDSGNARRYFGGIRNEIENSGRSQIRSSRSTR